MGSCCSGATAAGRSRRRSAGPCSGLAASYRHRSFTSISWRPRRHLSGASSPWTGSPATTPGADRPGRSSSAPRSLASPCRGARTSLSTPSWRSSSTAAIFSSPSGVASLPVSVGPPPEALPAWRPVPSSGSRPRRSYPSRNVPTSASPSPPRARSHQPNCSSPSCRTCWAAAPSVSRRTRGPTTFPSWTPTAASSPWSRS